MDCLDKTPQESLVVGVDFSPRLVGDEILVAGTSSYLVFDYDSETKEPGAQSTTMTPDPTSVAVTTLDHKTTDKVLVVRVSGGLAECDYLVRVLAGTSLNNLYSHDILVHVDSVVC